MNHSVLLQLEYPVPVELEEAAQLTLAAEGLAQPHELSVVVSDDEQLQALNAQFRGIDAPTDVLSFGAEPLPAEIQGDDPIYLGDILISLPYATRRAESEGHALADELRLLVIHGVLHLLGYDHDTPENQAIMWAKQGQILQQLHISLEVPAYLHDV